MWEQWRAEIDRSLRDAEMARDIWSDREFRAELRDDPERAFERFRLVSTGPLLAEDEVRPRTSWWERTVRWPLPRQAPASGAARPRT